MLWDCAQERTDGLDLRSLDEASLAEVYRWLADLFNPADDMIPEGVHVVGPEEAARHWRDTVLRELAQRPTSAAVSELTNLARDFPDRLDIAASLLVARGGVQANAWSPPSPEQVARLLSDARRRLVRSIAELATLLQDTLAAIAADLPAHGELLWDRQPASRRRIRSRTNAPGAPASANREQPTEDTWRPKPEAALSAYLAHEFALRLTGRGVAVNREVLVLPSSAYGAGDRTDIAVQATLIYDPYAATPAAAPDRLVVVVEVKGAWNDGLLSDQRNQLAVRYLPRAVAIQDFTLLAGIRSTCGRLHATSVRPRRVGSYGRTSSGYWLNRPRTSPVSWGDTPIRSCLRFHAHTQRLRHRHHLRARCVRPRPGRQESGWAASPAQVGPCQRSTTW